MARRKPSEGIGRLAAALASSDAAAPRIENRLVRLTVTTRWVTILAGIIFGFFREQNDHFALVSIALVVFAGIQTIYQLQPSSSPRLRVLVLTLNAERAIVAARTSGFEDVNLVGAEDISDPSATGIGGVDQQLGVLAVRLEMAAIYLRLVRG